MARRRDINGLHEATVLAVALREHNRLNGLDLKIVDRPDPPDAMLSDGVLTTWMEHTDAFYPGWAEDLSSFAASDKKHRPIRQNWHLNVDVTFAKIVCDRIEAKVRNTTYQSVVDQHGPGLLVVGLETPWLDRDTHAAIDHEWRQRGSPGLERYFRHVYFAFRVFQGRRAALWVHSAENGKID